MKNINANGKQEKQNFKVARLPKRKNTNSLDKEKEDAVFKLFLKFFKLGFISFGGGYAVIPLLYNEIYDIWNVTKTEFANLVGIFELTPGSLSVNAASYVGYQVGEVAGAILSTLGIVLPSFILMLIISSVMKQFKESEITDSVIQGVCPAAMGITCSSLIFFVGTSIVDAQAAQYLSTPLKVNIPAIIIAVLSYMGVTKKDINPIWITLGAGVLGIIML